MSYLPLGVDDTPTTLIYQHDGVTEVLPLNQVLVMLQLEALTNTFWVDKVPSTWNADAESCLQRLIDQSARLGEKIAITDMPVGLGYEVVAIDLIKKGAQILYCGKLLHALPDNDSYLLTFSSTKRQSYNFVSAKQQSNLTRLFAHASSATDLNENVTFHDDLIRSTVALPNFFLKVINIGGLSFSVLTALNDISKGDRLRWDYGLQHFIGLGITPCLFDKNSHLPIDSHHYHWQHTAISFICEQSVITHALSMQTLIETDQCAFLAHEDSHYPYDLYINAQFFKELLVNEPERRHQLIVEFPVPMNDHPYIKYFPTNKNADLFMLSTLKAILKEALLETTWQKVFITDNTMVNGKNVYWYSACTTPQAVTRSRHLSAMGFTAGADFFLHGIRFYILERIIFKTITSLQKY